MASRREYDMLFSLNAQLGSSYTGTFTKAQQQLIGMQKELDALAKRQSDIAAYQKQQSAAEATQKKLEVLQQQYMVGRKLRLPLELFPRCCRRAPVDRGVTR